MKLKGKVAVVTGTSPNIGGGIAEELAAEGATLVCVDRVSANATDCANYLKSTGGKALAIACDVTEESEVASSSHTSSCLRTSSSPLLKEVAAATPCCRLARL